MKPAKDLQAIQERVVAATIGDPDFCEAVRRSVEDAWQRRNQAEESYIAGNVGRGMPDTCVHNLSNELSVPYVFRYQNCNGQARVVSYDWFKVPVCIIPARGRVTPNGVAIFDWPKKTVTKRAIYENRAATPDSRQLPLQFARDEITSLALVDMAEAVNLSLLYTWNNVRNVKRLAAWFALGIAFRNQTQMYCSESVQVSSFELRPDEIELLQRTTDEPGYDIPLELRDTGT